MKWDPSQIKGAMPPAIMKTILTATHKTPRAAVMITSFVIMPFWVVGFLHSIVKPRSLRK